MLIGEKKNREFFLTQIKLEDSIVFRIYNRLKRKKQDDCIDFSEDRAL